MLANAQLVTLIPVKNMDRAIRFYTRNLGAKLRMRGTGEMRNYFAVLKIAQSEVWFIHPSKPEKRALAYSTFVVKNIRTVVRKLQEKKVKFQRAEPVGPSTKIVGPIAFEDFGAAAFFSDTEGNTLMLWQGASGG